MIDFKAGWGINHCPRVIGCLCVCVWRQRPSISPRRRLADCYSASLHSLWLPDTLLYTQCERGNAYLPSAGPSLHMHNIIWVSWGWIGWCANVKCCGLVITSLAAFVHLFADRLDGGVLVVYFCWPACLLALLLRSLTDKWLRCLFVLIKKSAHRGEKLCSLSLWSRSFSSWKHSYNHNTVHQELYFHNLQQPAHRHSSRFVNQQIHLVNVQYSCNTFLYLI